MSGTQSESSPIAGRPGQTVEPSTGLAISESDPVDHRAPLILGAQTFHAITEAVARPMERPATRGWWICFLISLSMLGLLGVSIAWLFWEGIGVWGLNNPGRLGLGHHQLRLLGRHRPRRHADLGDPLPLPPEVAHRRSTASAEAMTIFAVICALIFPGIHVGRVWVAYWLFPIPNQMGIWPNFRSPLLWDVFAVSTYGTVSLLFWYVGLVPDLATLRDRAKTEPAADRLRRRSPSAGAARRATGSTTRRPT